MASSLTLRRRHLAEEEEFLRAHRATSPEVSYFLHYYEEGMVRVTRREEEVFAAGVHYDVA